MYEITIKRTQREKVIVGGNWGVIGEEPMEGNPQIMKPIRGYTPQQEQDKAVTREILVQTVEDLDLPTVIKAINKL